MLKGTSKTVDALVQQLHAYLSNQQPSATAATACGEPEKGADRLLLGTGGGGEVADTELGGGLLDAKANTMLRSVRACVLVWCPFNPLYATRSGRSSIYAQY